MWRTFLHHRVYNKWQPGALRAGSHAGSSMYNPSESSGNKPYEISAYPSTRLSEELSLRVNIQASRGKIISSVLQVKRPESEFFATFEKKSHFVIFEALHSSKDQWKEIILFWPPSCIAKLDFSETTTPEEEQPITDRRRDWLDAKHLPRTCEYTHSRSPAESCANLLAWASGALPNYVGISTSGKSNHAYPSFTNNWPEDLLNKAEQGTFELGIRGTSTQQLR